MAKEYDIPGRSSMPKDELARQVAQFAADADADAVDADVDAVDATADEN
jgi:hypothetical protein